MVTFDSIEDALLFAVSKEEASANFYGDLAKESKDETTRLFFEELCRQEGGHKSTLELEIMKLGRVVKPSSNESFPRVSGVKTLLEMPDNLTYPNAIIIAMQKERASFRLYIELSRYSESDEIVELLLTLAEEEMRHKIQLEQIYNEVIKREN